MKVRAVCPVYIDNVYRDAGAVFDYHGSADPHLAPVPQEEVGLTLTSPPAVANIPATSLTPLPVLEALRIAAAAGGTEQPGPGITALRLPTTGAEDGADLLK